MAISRKEARPSRLPDPISPVKYVTENGFSIVRLSEINPSVIDRPGECRFLVQREDEAPYEVKVSFAEHLIVGLRLRRRIPLSETSMFWLVCAESCLAKYVWEKNRLPPAGQLMVETFSPEELMLGLHWRDGE